MKNVFRVALSAALAVPAMASAQQHTYLFNNSFADVHGGPSLVQLIPGSGTLSASGYTFGTNEGLTLSNVFAGGSSYSLVIRSYFTNQGNAGYKKIVDFKNQSTDEGYYNLSDRANLYNAQTSATAVYSASNLETTILTRDALTGEFRAYVDGVLALDLLDGGRGDFTSANGLATFFKDECGTCSEAAPGFVNYLSTFDTVLTADQVRDFQFEGEDAGDPTTAPEPASLVLLATGLFGVGAVARRRKRA